MAEPPRDKHGIVLPHDDEDINDEDGLLRQIHPKYHVCWDDNLKCHRITSAAFKESQQNAPYGGMSIEIESLLVADGIAPENRAHVKSGIVRLISADMRNLGFEVGSDPIKNHPEVSDNPYHGEVWGITKGMKKRAIKQAVLESYQWVKKIDGVK